ncbi:PAXNEB-domain-containing protein [Phanerochaete sordida]|uniref:Elongator complex protein 4 n=1 Tax=Phanerochaete sordida TaxID=48140 RepID=A0A9P3L8R7_9APHY|nr:PAXNEB-domain-containing protein [Phanerochaete sordida]
MSSFKRKTTAKQPDAPPGTKPLAGAAGVHITSTGIPSLDDILGGGLPLRCTQLVLAPDAHSAYGELVQKYFVAQGLAAGQDVCVVHECPRAFVEACMWTPAAPGVLPAAAHADEDEEKAAEGDAKIKIAWRYEQMKQFQTTVPASNQSGDDFCQVFDLTSRIPPVAVDAAISKQQLSFIEVGQSTERPLRRVLNQIVELLGPEESETNSRKALRVCIPALGSPAWGDVEPQDICYFLYSLRAALAKRRHACASISLPPYLCDVDFGGPGWVQKLGWLSDACVSLSAFTANPSLSAIFPSYHGFVHIHTLPSPLVLVPPSDRFSTLRGLSSSGENNLAFKNMRKRLVFETLHLDLEGGVSERRTTPATNTIETIVPPTHDHGHAHAHVKAGVAGMATVEVQLEQTEQRIIQERPAEVTVESTTATTTTTVKKKPKKRVAFQSDRPDLYDF